MVSNAQAVQTAGESPGHTHAVRTNLLNFLIVAILTTAALIVEEYFHLVLHSDTVFTQLFYIPIILAAYWFGYRGIAVPILIASALISTHIWQAEDMAMLGDDLLSSCIFIVISLVTAVLRARKSRAEWKLGESEQRFRMLFVSSHDAIMTIEPPTWNFTSGNSATIRMFGCKDEKEFISRAPWQFSPKMQPDGQPSGDKAKKMIMKAMKEGSNFFEWDHMRKNGEVFPATVLLTRLEIGGKQFIQATVRDITEVKRAEETLKNYSSKLEESVKERTKELQKAKAELEKSVKKLGDEDEALMSMMSGMGQKYTKLKEMDVMKDEFLRMTAHELDTPLTPVKMQAQLWLDGAYGKITPKQKESFEVILRNADRSITLIGEVMMMSELDSGRVLFEFKPADLGELAKEAVAAHKKDAAGKGLGLKLEIQKKLPKAKMDSGWIRQALNLCLDNAVKFTEKGSITVSVRKANGNLEVLVKDTGVGMTPDVLAKIFARFYQGDKTITRKYGGGTGLGLPIVKAIVDKHGGKAWGESEGLGKGSTFGFSIPVKR